MDIMIDVGFYSGIKTRLQVKHRMFLRSLFLSLLGVSCIELEFEDSCSELIEYICTCHSKNKKYNCVELKNIYQNADFEQQEQCALQLDDQIYEDTKNNFQCASNTQPELTKEKEVKEKTEKQKDVKKE